MFATCVIATGVLSFEISFFYVYVVWYVEAAINNMVLAFVDKIPMLPTNHSTSECASKMLHVAIQFAEHDNELLLKSQGQSTLLSAIIISMMLLMCTVMLNRHGDSDADKVAGPLEEVCNVIPTTPTRPRRHTEHDGTGPWSQSGCAPALKNNYVQ